MKPEPEFFAGEAELREAAEALFGSAPQGRDTRIMATLPEESGSRADYVRHLVSLGMDSARVNCAHGGPEIWARLVEAVRTAGREVDKPIPVLMDLSGPRLRTLQVFPEERRLHAGDHLRLVREPADEKAPWATVNLPQVLDDLQPGQRVFMDEGKLQARVQEVQQWGAMLEVLHAGAKGVRLRPEKGLNLPDTELNLSALTPEDLKALDFVTAHADLVGYSFVQTPEDVEHLLREIAARPGGRLRGLVLKIETAKAVANLPEIVVCAAGQMPAALMIARGDLAVELGYERLAEVQEEMLWLAEAASVPVVWATQVLDRLVKKGTPSRPEVSDAVLAARAECVMLNKGAHLAEGIEVLAEVLERMQAHQYKKTPRLRALHSWQR